MNDPASKALAILHRAAISALGEMAEHWAGPGWEVLSVAPQMTDASTGIPVSGAGWRFTLRCDEMVRTGLASFDMQLEYLHEPRLITEEDDGVPRVTCIDCAGRCMVPLYDMANPDREPQAEPCERCQATGRIPRDACQEESPNLWF